MIVLEYTDDEHWLRAIDRSARFEIQSKRDADVTESRVRCMRRDVSGDSDAVVLHYRRWQHISHPIRVDSANARSIDHSSICRNSIRHLPMMRCDPTVDQRRIEEAEQHYTTLLSSRWRFATSVRAEERRRSDRIRNATSTIG